MRLWNPGEERAQEGRKKEESGRDWKSPEKKRRVKRRDGWTETGRDFVGLVKNSA